LGKGVQGMAGAQGAIREVMGKNRLENLTDGIFAFAMTLLVLGIEVPTDADAAAQALSDMNPVKALLVSLYPDITHYMLAFVIIAAFWVIAHSFSEHIRYVDRKLLWLNIAKLMFVALIPFSTDLADTYVQFPNAALLFEANIVIVGALMYLQWAYASRNHLLISPGLPDSEIKHTKVTILVMPAIALVAMGVALMGVTWSMLLFVLAPLIYALPLKKLVG